MPFSIPYADICVVAGDVTDGIEASLRWMAGCIRPHMPVIAVLGNHEFFGHDIPEGRRTAARLASDLDIHLLDDSETVIEGVRFVGGTLWTDFRLFENVQGDLTYSQRDCMSASRRVLADYDEIWATESVGGQMPRRFGPRDAVDLHETNMSYLDRALAQRDGRPVVVVTHHAPSPLSVAEPFRRQVTTAAFASNLDEFIAARQPDTWIHGHMHESFDYKIGNTRIVCNPRGYEIRPNAAFNPDMTIAVR